MFTVYAAIDTIYGNEVLWVEEFVNHSLQIESLTLKVNPI